MQKSNLMLTEGQTRLRGVFSLLLAVTSLVTNSFAQKNTSSACPISLQDELTPAPECTNQHATEFSTLENVLSRFYDASYSLRGINCCSNDDYTQVVGFQVFHRSMMTGQMQASYCIGDCMRQTCEFVILDMFGKVEGMSTLMSQDTSASDYYLTKLLFQTERGLSLSACSRNSHSNTETQVQQEFSFIDGGPLVAFSGKTVVTAAGDTAICSLVPWTDSCPYHPYLAQIPQIQEAVSLRIPSSESTATFEFTPFNFDAVTQFYNGAYIQAPPEPESIEASYVLAPSPTPDTFVTVSGNSTVKVSPLQGVTPTFQYWLELHAKYLDWELVSGTFSVDVCVVHIELNAVLKEVEQFIRSNKKTVRVDKRSKMAKESKKIQVKIDQAGVINQEDYQIIQDCGTTVIVLSELRVLNPQGESMPFALSTDASQDSKSIRKTVYDEENARLLQDESFTSADQETYLEFDLEGQNTLQSDLYDVVQYFIVEVDGVRESSLEPSPLSLMNLDVYESVDSLGDDEDEKFEGAKFKEIKPPLTCDTTQLVPSTIHSMVFQLGGDPIIQNFKPFDDTYSIQQGVYSGCGEFSYKLTSDTLNEKEIAEFLTLNNTELTLATDDHSLFGPHTVHLVVGLVSRPYVNTTVTFTVSVKKDEFTKLAQINELPYFMQAIANELRVPVLQTVELQLPEVFDLEDHPVSIRVKYGNKALRACNCAIFNEDTRKFTFRLTKEFENTLSLVQIFLADDYGESYFYFYLRGVSRETQPDFVLPKQKVEPLPDTVSQDFDFDEWLLNNGYLEDESDRQQEAKIPLQIAVGKVDHLGVIKVKFSEEIDLLSPKQLEELREQQFIQVRLIGNNQQNFNWTMSQDPSKLDELLIQVQFESPSDISAQVVDQLAVFFLNADQYFFSDEVDAILPFYSVRKKLSPQVDPLLKSTQRLADFSELGEIILKTLVLQNLVFAFIFKTSLQTLWGAINAMQIVAFLPLYNVNFPANAYFMFDMLVQVVSFDFAQPTEIWEFDITETDPINERAEWLGFESQNIFDDLGSVNFIIALLLVNSIILPLVAMMANKHMFFATLKKYCGDSMSVTQGWTRFFLETYLELLICIIVSTKFFKLVDPDNISGWDWFSMFEYIILTVCVTAFIVFVGWFLLFWIKWLVKVNYRDLTLKHSEIMLALYGVDHIKRRLTLKGTGAFKAIQSDLKRTFERQNTQLCSIQTSGTEIDSESDDQAKRFDKFHDMFKREVSMRSSDKETSDKLMQLYSRMRAKIQKDLVGKKPDAAQLKEEQRKAKKYEWFSPLYEGLKVYSKSAQWYNFIFLIRRVIFCFTAFFVFNHPTFQVWIYLFGSVGELTYLIWCRPFATKMQSKLEVFNELCVLMVAYHMLSLSGWTLDSSQSNLIGWSLIVFVAMLSTVNILFNVWNQLDSIVWKAKLCWYRRKYRKVSVKNKYRMEAKVHPSSHFEHRRTDSAAHLFSSRPSSQNVSMRESCANSFDFDHLKKGDTTVVFKQPKLLVPEDIETRSRGRSFMEDVRKNGFTLHAGSNAPSDKAQDESLANFSNQAIDRIVTESDQTDNVKNLERLVNGGSSSFDSSLNSVNFSAPYKTDSDERLREYDVSNSLEKTIKAQLKHLVEPEPILEEEIVSVPSYLPRFTSDKFKKQTPKKKQIQKLTSIESVEKSEFSKEKRTSDLSSLHEVDYKKQTLFTLHSECKKGSFSLSEEASQSPSENSIDKADKKYQLPVDDDYLPKAK